MTKPKPKSHQPPPFTPPPPGYMRNETARIAAKYARIRSGQLSALEIADLKDEIAADERDLSYVKTRLAENRQG